MKRNCLNCKHNKKEPFEFPCRTCSIENNYLKHEKQTNADRIRDMSDKELAAFLFMHNCKIGSVERILEWLQMEVEE